MAKVSQNFKTLRGPESNGSKTGVEELRKEKKTYLYIVRLLMGTGIGAS